MKRYRSVLYDIQSLLVQTLANSSAGMDQSELLSLVAGLFDDSSLQSVENHAQSGRTGGTLGVLMTRGQVKLTSLTA